MEVMHDRTPKLGPRGPARRLTALVALGALVVPSVRGLLCSAGGHEASHAAGAVAAVSASHTADPVSAAPPTAHAHGSAAGPTAATADRLPPPRAALDRASTDDAGCHALMSCGVTLVAAEWADSPRSSRLPVAGAPERPRNLLLDRPGLGPALPPPRA